MKYFAKIKKDSQIHRNWWYKRLIGGVLHNISFYYDTTTGEYVSKEINPLQAKIASQYRSYITVELISNAVPSFIEEPAVPTEPTNENTESTPEEPQPLKKSSKRRLSMDEINAG